MNEILSGDKCWKGPLELMGIVRTSQFLEFAPVSIEKASFNCW